MVTVCLTCGDRGFVQVMVNCPRCQDSAQHVYCLDVIPVKYYEDDFTWVCDDCKKRKRFKKKSNRKKLTGSVAKTKVQICEGNPPEHEAKGSEDQVNSSHDLAASVKTLQLAASDPSEINEDCYIAAQPIIDLTWRGSLSIMNKDFSIISGLVAHLSSLACAKVFEEAKLLPMMLFPDLVCRVDVWPKAFQSSGPSDHSIALYFFSCQRMEGLAMRAVLDNTELLVFTSSVLREHIQRFQTKLYLWGVFRGKQSSPLTNDNAPRELMKLAQEQMSRISPADFARMQQQMMANPELMKMASESMKNMRPEDLKLAAEQLKHTRPEEMAEIGDKISSASPEEIAAMHARVDAQVSYKLNAAQMLKNQGNALHSQGKFNDASQKYVLAKTNLNGIPSSKGKSLLMACSLNLMSCYLKTRQYDECIKEGSEVLAYDAQNVKALYRRGQAYKELGQLEDAISDLSMAHEVSPDDETIADVLRDAKEKLGTEGSVSAPRRLVIEEITEEVETVPSSNRKRSSTKLHETRDIPKTQIAADSGVPSNNSERLKALKNDPATLRSFQNFISNSDPDTLAALSSGKSEEVPADMVKTASSMIGKMSPEELKRMIEMASSFEGDNPFLKGGAPNLSPDMLKTASDMMSNMPPEELQKMFEMASKGKGLSTPPSNLDNFKPGSIPPNLSPDMLKTASDMMSKMPPEDLQNFFEMASSMTGRDSSPTPASLNANRQSSSKYSESRENSAVNVAHNEGASSSDGVLPNVRSTPQSSFPASATDVQEHMRNQMKDPAMRQMMLSMMKNMSPDMMANMSQQFGLNLSLEDAEKAHQAMSSLSPESLDKMMQWMDRVQRGVEGARKTKNWLLGKSGLILAIVMLILAVILHHLGYIGG